MRSSDLATDKFGLLSKIGELQLGTRAFQLDLLLMCCCRLMLRLLLSVSLSVVGCGGLVGSGIETRW